MWSEDWGVVLAGAAFGPKVPFQSRTKVTVERLSTTYFFAVSK